MQTDLNLNQILVEILHSLINRVQTNLPTDQELSVLGVLTLSQYNNKYLSPTFFMFFRILVMVLCFKYSLYFALIYILCSLDLYVVKIIRARIHQEILPNTLYGYYNLGHPVLYFVSTFIDVRIQGVSKRSFFISIFIGLLLWTLLLLR